MTKVLFSTPCQPYPTEFANDSLTDLTSQRLTKGQDIFTLSGHMHCHGCHTIAQNISAPSVFLEYPFWEDFEAEVHKGYDFVGISYFPTCTNIVLDMCKMVRRLAPNSKIVLGHYGALAFEAAFSEEFKKEHADHVCIGEGVRFFRQLLGEPVDAPLHQSHLPKCGTNLPWLDLHPRGNVGWITAGLGCPSGCDFCSTTQMHGNARIQLATPQQVFDEMKRIYREDPNTQQVMVYDEDYLKYTDEVRELCRLIMEDTEFGPRKLNWFALSSIESVNQYNLDELALGGFGTTFIGIESKFAPDKGYEKRTGDAKETIEGLQQRGIACLGGFMCGFDFHDRVNIEEDLNYYISLGLCSHQISQVTPFPGTPLYERLKEEGRVDEQFSWEDVNFYGGNFKHKNFEDHEVKSFILNAYRRYYQAWGPTLMRQLRVELNGYEHAASKLNEHPLWEQRAKRHQDAAELLYPMIRASEHFAPNGIVRRKIRQYDERYRRHFGEPLPSQVIQSYYVLAKAFQGKAHDAVFPREGSPKEEPFKKFVYDKKGNGRSGPPYKVLYPRESRSYEAYRDFRRVKEDVFGKVLSLIDDVAAPAKSASREEKGGRVGRIKML